MASLFSIVGGTFAVGGIFAAVLDEKVFVVCYPIGLALILVPYGIFQLILRVEQ